MGCFATIAARVAVLLPFAAPPGSPARGGRRMIDELEAILAGEALEAGAFLLRHGGEAVESFVLLALAVESAHGRDRASLAQIEAIEALPRPNSRGHGLEWAYEELFLSAERTGQVVRLLRALAPHEAEVRALLAPPLPQTGGPH